MATSLLTHETTNGELRPSWLAFTEIKSKYPISQEKTKNTFNSLQKFLVNVYNYTGKQYLTRLVNKISKSLSFRPSV